MPAFNRLPAEEARDLLKACLDVPRWVQEVQAGRPYPDWSTLRAAAMRSSAQLTDDELTTSLGRHPRIGERAGPGHDGAHSTREQAGLDPDDGDVAAQLRVGNAAYEKRFGRVFLIRAAGRSGTDILAELNRRLATDDATERGETVRQLSEIAVARLNVSLQ